jgi:lysophospholipase L1-like esterase
LIAPIALTLGLLLAAAPLASAASPSQPPQGLSYVALGDSYAAGFGQTPTTGKPVKGCGQAADDYPHRVARTLDLRLTDMTCEGAATANILTTPEKVGKIPAPPQSSALGADTRVVTITIGGNDLDFVDVMNSCLAATPTGPILKTKQKTCKASFVKNGVDTLASRITDTVGPRLRRTFATIRSDAPNAKVFVLGYPALMPDAAHTPAGGCFLVPVAGRGSAFTIANAFPYTNTDVAYLHSVEVALDRVTSAEAKRAGFAFVSLLAGSEAHTPCGPTPWLNGITVKSSDWTFTLEPGALHPTSAGEAYAARTIVPSIREALVSTSSPAPSSQPRNPHNSPSLVLWYLSLVVIGVVLLGAALVLVRRRRTR